MFSATNREETAIVAGPAIVAQKLSCRRLPRLTCYCRQGGVEGGSGWRVCEDWWVEFVVSGVCGAGAWES